MWEISCERPVVKKGRHRRFEEARALKRGPDVDIEGILDQPSEPSAWDEEDEAERKRWAEPD